LAYAAALQLRAIPHRTVMFGGEKIEAAAGPDVLRPLS
jgi:hypothetical protein